MTLSRRSFLGVILAAGVAPAAIGSGILMPVRKLWTPPGLDELKAKAIMSLLDEMTDDMLKTEHAGLTFEGGAGLLPGHVITIEGLPGSYLVIEADGGTMQVEPATVPQRIKPPGCKPFSRESFARRRWS